MQASFETVIRTFGNNTGIEVPPSVLAELGAGKRPAVHISVEGYEYSSTVGAMAGLSLISLSKAHRVASGLSGGQAVQVVLTLIDTPRSVEVPPELRAALEAAGLAKSFDGLAYSRRKEFARQVDEAKAAATKERRVAKIVADLKG
jgi:hypothetical protein